MISGLEKFAIIKAQESRRYRVENSVIPKYEIDEYDLVAVVEIYDEIQFIMATLGYKMNDAKMDSSQKRVFHTTATASPRSAYTTARNSRCWKAHRSAVCCIRAFPGRSSSSGSRRQETATLCKRIANII